MQTKHRGLLLLDATATLAGDRPLPGRFLVLPWGEFDTRYGRLKVNETTLKVLAANQKAAKRERVHVDFSHNTVPGTKYFMGEPAHLAARRAGIEVVAGEGIYLSAVEWTPEAEKHKHDYPEVSAAPVTLEDGTVVYLDSVAVCRHAEVEGMVLPLSAETAAALSQSAGPNTPTTQHSNQKEKTMDYKKLLLQILDLPETASDDEITKAAEDKGTEEETETAAGGEAGKGAKTGKADAVKTLSASVTSLAQQVESLERGRIVDAAVAAGKIIPLHADELPLDKFRRLVDGLPANQVPLAQRTPEHIKTVASTGLGQGAAPGAGAGNDDAIRESMGIPKERWDAEKAKK